MTDDLIVSKQRTHGHPQHQRIHTCVVGLGSFKEELSSGVLRVVDDKYYNIIFVTLLHIPSGNNRHTIMLIAKLNQLIIIPCELPTVTA